MRAAIFSRLSVARSCVWLADRYAAMYPELSPPLNRALVIAAIVMLCALSIFQMLQYWHGVMPMADTTWPQYRAAFLRGWW